MFNKVKNYFKDNMESIAMGLAYVSGNGNVPHID